MTLSWDRVATSWVRRAPARPSALLAIIAFATVACGDDHARTLTDDNDLGDTSRADTGDATVTPDTPDATPPPTCDDPQLDSLRLTAVGTTLRDAHGRAVHLRGVDAGGRSKLPPYVPFAYADADPSAPPFDQALAAYWDRIKAWGLDVVRMPFTWEAVEPTRGAYDEAFLARLDAMIAAAGARGIRVVLDFHQDVFARRYCGDGFPEWALGNPDAQTPADCSSWFLGYFQNADVQADFDRFWNNDDGLRDAYEALWTMIAERYADSDAVIGFEPINEPGWGSGDANVFSRDVLTPFYTRMIAVIHAAAPDQLVFADPTGLDGVTLTTGLTRPDGDGLVFAPHYYDAVAVAATSGGAAPDPSKVMPSLAKWRAVGDAWQVPVFVGELGVPYDAPGAAAFMRAHWEALQALGIHGAEWEYSVTGDHWNAEAMSVVDAAGTERPVAAELARAYPIAIAGTLASWSFDRDTAVAELTIDDADGTSLIAAPARLYPGGPNLIEVESSTACARWDPAREIYLVGGVGSLHLKFGPRAPP